MTWQINVFRSLMATPKCGTFSGVSVFLTSPTTVRLCWMSERLTHTRFLDCAIHMQALLLFTIIQILLLIYPSPSYLLLSLSMCVCYSSWWLSAGKQVRDDDIKNTFYCREGEKTTSMRGILVEAKKYALCSEMSSKKSQKYMRRMWQRGSSSYQSPCFKKGRRV